MVGKVGGDPAWDSAAALNAVRDLERAFVKTTTRLGFHATSKLALDDQHLQLKSREVGRQLGAPQRRNDRKHRLGGLAHSQCPWTHTLPGFTISAGPILDCVSNTVLRLVLNLRLRGRGEAVPEVMCEILRDMTRRLPGHAAFKGLMTFDREYNHSRLYAAFPTMSWFNTQKTTNGGSREQLRARSRQRLSAFVGTSRPVCGHVSRNVIRVLHVFEQTKRLRKPVESQATVLLFLATELRDSTSPRKATTLAAPGGARAVRSPFSGGLTCPQSSRCSPEHSHSPASEPNRVHSPPCTKHHRQPRSPWGPRASPPNQRAPSRRWTSLALFK
jgi:hypothetical protein